MTDWMNVTVETYSDIQGSYAMVDDPESVARSCLEEELGGEVLPRSPLTVQTQRVKDLSSLAQQLFEACPVIERILLVRISSSTHAGDGALYERDNTQGTGKKVDEWGGYEGAQGADVVGYFRENYNIKGSYNSPY